MCSKGVRNKCPVEMISSQAGVFTPEDGNSVSIRPSSTALGIVGWGLEPQSTWTEHASEQHTVGVGCCVVSHVRWNAPFGLRVWGVRSENWKWKMIRAVIEMS